MRRGTITQVASTPAEQQHLRDLTLLLTTKDLDNTFERVQAGSQDGHVKVVQEPTEQPYGVRDCAVRDPAGNLIRILRLR